jgi:hypothetical protein
MSLAIVAFPHPRKSRTRTTTRTFRRCLHRAKHGSSLGYALMNLWPAALGLNKYKPCHLDKRHSTLFPDHQWAEVPDYVFPSPVDCLAEDAPTPTLPLRRECHFPILLVLASFVRTKSSISALSFSNLFWDGNQFLKNERSQRRVPAIKNTPPNIKLAVPPMIDEASSNVRPLAAHTWCLFIRDNTPSTENPNARMTMLMRGTALFR